MSASFLLLIIAGYVSGATAKVIGDWGGLSGPSWLVALYLFNGGMVSVALFLTLRFRNQPSSLARSRDLPLALAPEFANH